MKALLVAALLAASLTGSASATNLSTNLYQNCTQYGYCFVDVPYAQPASGEVDFGLIGQPWSYSFTTGSPLHIDCKDWYCQQYDETFNSGTFLMSGPAGLTFAGNITSGIAYNFGGDIGARLSFSGRWSNGQYATGSFNDIFREEGGWPYATLTTATSNPLSPGGMQPVPEPGSLALLGGGALALWKVARRS